MSRHLSQYRDKISVYKLTTNCRIFQQMNKVTVCMLYDIFLNLILMINLQGVVNMSITLAFDRTNYFSFWDGLFLHPLHKLVSYLLWITLTISAYSFGKTSPRLPRERKENLSPFDRQLFLILQGTKTN